MKWLINLFLGRIFVYLKKLAGKTETLLDDNTVKILEKHIKDAVNGIYHPKDAMMNFISDELQMLIDYGKANTSDNKIWAFLSGIQSMAKSLDLNKK